MLSRCARSLFCIALLVAVSPATADEIILISGDRLTGRVVHKGGDILTFETRSTGPIKLKWSDVVALSTDKPVDTLFIGDEAPVNAILSSAYEGTVDLIGGESDIPLARIAFINPTPEESGRGAIYSARLTASATHVRGNARTDQSYADADFSARSKNYRYTLGGKINKVEEAGMETASSWLVGGNYDRFLTEKRFIYLRGSRESDPFKGIDWRSTVGAGYGVQFIETLRTSVSLRGGIDYVVVNRINEEDERYPALGWGIRTKHKLGERGTELFHEQDGFLNTRDTNQIILRSRTGLRIPLFSGLNASLQFNLDWEREPVPGRRPVDVTLLLGMGYTW